MLLHSSLASKKYLVNSYQLVYFSSLLAIKPQVCISFTDQHQLLMGHTELTSVHSYCHTSFLFSLPPWRCRKLFWFAFLTSVKRSSFMITIFSNKNRLRHEWDLISFACHSHRKKQKIEMAGLLRVTVCIYLLLEVRGRYNSNWITEV